MANQVDKENKTNDTTGGGANFGVWRREPCHEFLESYHRISQPTLSAIVVQ